MSNPVGGVGNLPQPQTTEALQTAAAAVGTAYGERVNVLNPTRSALGAALDIAEEISFVRKQFSKLDDKEIEEKKDDRETLLQLIKKVQAIDPIDGLDAFKGQLLEQLPLTREQFREEAAAAFDDVFHQYVALEELAEAIIELHGEEAAADVQTAIRELKEEHTQEVTAGLNLTEAAAEELQNLGLSQPLSDVRSRYLDHVNDHKNLSKAYAQITEYGGDNFEKSIQLQLRLLAVDLDCTPSSTQPERLQAVINDMQTLKTLAGTHDHFQQTAQQLSREPFLLNISGNEMMLHALTLTEEPFINSSMVANFFDQFALDDLDTKIFIANATTEFFRTLPDAVFTNVEARTEALNAVTQLKDQYALEESGMSDADDHNYAVIGTTELDDNESILDDLSAINVGTKDSLVPDFVDKPESKAPPAAQVDASAKLQGQDSLIAQRDEKLLEAEQLMQRRCEKQVVTSALDALKVATSGDGDPFAMLQAITKQRGKSFAKGLKVAITPAGEDKAIKLIPPDKALRDDPRLAELLQTAIEVLAHEDQTVLSGLDIASIDKSLEKIREKLAALDANLAQYSRKQATGVEQLNAIESSRKFTYTAQSDENSSRVALDYESSEPIYEEPNFVPRGNQPAEENPYLQPVDSPPIYKNAEAVQVGMKESNPYLEPEDREPVYENTKPDLDPIYDEPDPEPIYEEIPALKQNEDTRNRS